MKQKIIARTAYNENILAEKSLNPRSQISVVNICLDNGKAVNALVKHSN